MTTTQYPSTAYAPVRPADVRVPLRRVAGRSVVAVATGAAVLFAYGAAAIAVHGPLSVGEPGDTVPINAASFSIGVRFSAFFGVVLAVALARWTKRPDRIFARAAIALTVVSLWAPFTAETDQATRWLLGGGHVVAAFVVIPFVVRALRTERV